MVHHRLTTTVTRWKWAAPRLAAVMVGPLAIGLAVLLLAACDSLPTPSPTPTRLPPQVATATPTPSPTPTREPPTPTPSPTATPTPPTPPPLDIVIQVPTPTPTSTPTPTVIMRTPTPTPTSTPVPTLADIIAQVRNSVVVVEGSGGMGSGFLLDGAGVLVSVQSVVQDDRVVRVTIHDGTQYNAVVAETDPAADLAFLQIITTEPLDIPALTLASEQLRLGDTVLALGYPLGLSRAPGDLASQISVTQGIISSLRVSRPDGITLVQTDAPVGLGNRGGPLVDARGNVVGVLTSREALIGVDATGVAVQVGHVRELLPAALTSAEQIRLMGDEGEPGFLSAEVPEGYRMETYPIGNELLTFLVPAGWNDVAQDSENKISFDDGKGATGVVARDGPVAGPSIPICVSVQDYANAIFRDTRYDLQLAAPQQELPGMSLKVYFEIDSESSQVKGVALLVSRFSPGSIYCLRLQVQVKTSLWETYQEAFETIINTLTITQPSS